MDYLRRKSEGNVMASIPSSPRDVDLLPAPSHGRQPSQEELECDVTAMALGRELEGREVKLSEVLRSDVTKKRMQYMGGLFSAPSENGAPGGMNSSLPKDTPSDPSTPNPDDLMRHKEDLLAKLDRKLDVLKAEKVKVMEEMEENTRLGGEVSQHVETCCPARGERDKYRAYIDDLEKIVRLLLNLSGQLARAENAVTALNPLADPKLKKMTHDKRERLHSKHEEAKLLKVDMDKRSDQLATLMKVRLDDGQFSSFATYVRRKSQLTLDLQELEDNITRTGDQRGELCKSLGR